MNLEQLMAADVNCLAHEGIKGQKWGVRNYRNYDGTLTPEGRERYGYGPPHDRSKNQNGSNKTRTRTNAKNVNRKRTIDDLSDDELNKLVTRLRMERDFKELVSNPAATANGRAKRESILKTTGKEIFKRVAVTAGSGAALYMLYRAAGGEKFNRSDFAASMFYGGAGGKRNKK